MHKRSRPKKQILRINIDVKLPALNGGESSKVRRRISQGAKEPGAKEPGSEPAKGRKARHQFEAVSVCRKIEIFSPTFVTTDANVHRKKLVAIFH